MVIALGLAAVLLGVDHAPPFGPLAMVALLVAVAGLERGTAAAPAAAGPTPAAPDTT